MQEDAMQADLIPIEQHSIDWWMARRAEWAESNQRNMTPAQIAWADKMMDRPLWRGTTDLPIAYYGSGYYQRGATFYLHSGHWKYRPYPKSLQCHESIGAANARMVAENHAKGISVLGGPLY